MKKRTGIYNGIYGRKLRLTWIALILIFSLISVSAAGNGTDSQENPGVDLEQKIEAGNGIGGLESAEVALEEKIEASNGTDSKGSEEENLKPEIEIGNGTNSPESAGDKLESNSGVSSETDSNGSEGENREQKTGEIKVTESPESVGDKPELDTEAEKGTESPGNEEAYPEQKIKAEKSSQSEEEKSIEEKSVEEKSVEEKSVEEKSVEEKSVEEKPEQKTGTNNDIDNQENTEENLETKARAEKETSAYGETASQESIGERPEQKQEANDGSNSPGNKGENLKLKIIAEDRTDGSGSAEATTETKTEVCNVAKSLKSEGMNPETKIKKCNWTKNLESGEVSPEITITAWNWIYSPKEEVKPETKPGKSSWNNMKLILSYPYSLHSFYTANESVKVNYKGPEAFGKQNVDVYLVRERNPSFSEEAVSNGMNENTISFEDVFNNNTESYIEIPATLNDDGDLSSLTLGPLPAGSYWVLITLAGNETEKSESEKEILLANYFEVLEYEMEADAPNTLEEGENFEVNLNLKNAPAQENYTYWAVLIREDACRANINISANETKAKTSAFVDGLDIIRNLGINLTKSESIPEKAELKNKIQTLIGEGNGTISIGEENQSTLSLTSHGLPSGNYVLLAGACEKNKGLAGIAQRKLTISSTKKSYESYSKSHSGIQGKAFANFVKKSL